MLRQIASAAMLSASLAATAAPPDVKGWQAYTWGMTSQEVARAGASSANCGPAWWAPDRSFFVECREAITLSGEGYSAMLKMDPKTGGLMEVRISDTAPAIGRVAPQREQFKALEALLVQKYGPAHLNSDVDNTKRGDSPALTLVRTWTFPSTIIELRHEWSYGMRTVLIGTMTITYKPAKLSDSNKL